jgi:hypothetical protein
LRTGNCEQKSSVFYSTEELKSRENSAREDEDFEPIRKAEITFDSGEIEKTIEIKLNIEDDDDIALE